MKKKRQKRKYYEILSENKKHRYGAFPYTDKGREDAEKYLIILTKDHKEAFFIKEI
jgi:hypothetical protein